MKCWRKFYFLVVKGLEISRDYVLVLRVGGVEFYWLVVINSGGRTLGLVFVKALPAHAVLCFFAYSCLWLSQSMKYVIKQSEHTFRRKKKRKRKIRIWSVLRFSGWILTLGSTMEKCHSYFCKWFPFLPQRFKNIKSSYVRAHAAGFQWPPNIWWPQEEFTLLFQRKLLKLRTSTLTLVWKQIKINLSLDDFWSRAIKNFPF